MKFLPTKARMYLVFLWLFKKKKFEGHILNIHDLNTSLNYLFVFKSTIIAIETWKLFQIFLILV